MTERPNYQRNLLRKIYKGKVMDWEPRCFVNIGTIFDSDPPGNIYTLSGVCSHCGCITNVFYDVCPNCGYIWDVLIRR